MSRSEKLARDMMIQGLKPDPVLTVTEWADQYRILSTKSAEPGRYSSLRTPYVREIMECLSPSSPVTDIVLMKPAQVAGTEVGNNWLLFIMHQAPGPAMLVLPSLDLAKRNSKTKLDDAIESTPEVRALVKDPRERDSGNTQLMKEFPGGMLIITGANSAISLRSTAVRYLMMDEVDGFPGDTDGEGCPIRLARARTTTFKRRRKIYLNSTPNIKGKSRIEKAYEESDKRRYYVPCPHCHKHQILKFERLRWPKGSPQEVKYVCEHCEKPIPEHHKTWMLEQGEWRAEKPGYKQGKVAGFHISGLYSPQGWLGWDEIAEEWEAIQNENNQERTKGFVNLILAETWEEKGDAPPWKGLYDRRETYPVNTIPDGVIFCTAGVDVQKNRLECEIVGWGKGKESWSIDYRIIMGDPSTDEPWKKLDELLHESWKLKNGNSIRIERLAIDTGGHWTSIVYNWARKYPDKVLAVRGVDAQRSIFAKPKLIDVNFDGQVIPKSLFLYNVGVSLLKSELYGLLKLEKPLDGQAFPAGYCHFPEYNDEYFKQLTGEQLITKKTKRGFLATEWHKHYKNNEALDARNYARAAASVFGIDFFEDTDWEQLKEQLGHGLLQIKSSEVPTEDDEPLTIISTMATLNW